MNTLFGVIYGKPTQFVGYLRRYDVTLAVVIPDSIEAQELAKSADWEKIYSDPVGILFQKRSGAAASTKGDRFDG
jgi:hypothetical protein